MGYGTITVTDSATLIVSSNDRRKSLRLTNMSNSDIVYIGPDSSITTTNGTPLYETQRIEESWTSIAFWKGDVYGIVTTTNSADIRYWEVT